MAQETIDFPSQFPDKANPDYRDVVLGYDSQSGDPISVRFETLQSAAATNIIGTASPSSSPSGTETDGQSYRVSNTTTSDQTFTNFDGVVVPAKTWGLITLSGGVWEYVENPESIQGLMPSGDYAGTGQDLNADIQVRAEKASFNYDNYFDYSKKIDGYFVQISSVPPFQIKPLEVGAIYRFPSREGDVWTLTGLFANSTQQKGFAFLDANGAPISGVAMSEADNILPAAPEGTLEIAFSVTTVQPPADYNYDDIMLTKDVNKSLKRGISYLDGVPFIDPTVDDKIKTATGYQKSEIIDYSDIETGGYIDANGSWVANSDFAETGFIPVFEGQKYIYRNNLYPGTGVSVQGSILNLYGKDKARISSPGVTSRDDVGLSDINGLKYIRSNFRPGNVGGDIHNLIIKLYGDQDLGVNLIDFDNLVTGAINTSGQLVSGSNKVTAFIPVNSLSIHLFKAVSTSYYSDANESSFIRQIKLDGVSYCTPSNATFVRLELDVNDLLASIMKLVNIPFDNYNYLEVLSAKDFGVTVPSLDSEGKLSPSVLPDSVNAFSGKKCAIIGTSLTYAQIPAGYPGAGGQQDGYAKLMCQKLGMTFANYGISGSTIGEGANEYMPFVNRYQDLPDDAVFIGVEGGTNDFRKHILLGTINDTTSSTFYGALHIVVSGLINKYIVNQDPDIAAKKKLFLITPLKYGTDLDTPNAEGSLMIDFVNAVKEIGEYYSIPVFDSYHLSGLTPNLFNTWEDTDGNITYREMPDHTHPTPYGHEIWANTITGWLKSVYA